MRRGRGFVLMVAATLGAGSCNDGNDGGALPGPRIVAWQIQADGTPPFVVGSYDTREKVHCRFLLDEQGQLRCLPTSAVELTETTAFADATCQTRLYTTTPGQEGAFADHPVAVPLPRADCAPKRYAVATLKPIGEGATRYSGTPCVAIDGLASANDGTLVIDRSEPPDKWAIGTEVDGPRLSGRVRIREVQTEEGALFGDHLVDEALGKACNSQTPGVNGPICEPTVLRFDSANEGTDCMGPLAWRAPACADPAFIADGAHEYAIGPKWTGPVSTRTHGCGQLVSRFGTDGPDVYYERGAPLEPFVPVAFELTGVGTGRLQLRGVKTDDGSIVILDDALGSVAARYFDLMTNSDCDPVRTAEGLVRCIPAALVDPFDFPDLFSDAACTSPVHFCPSSWGATSCDGLTVLSTTHAAGPIHAVAVHKSVLLTAVFAKSNVDGTCQPAALPSFQLFAVGDELPWDAFPLLTETNGRADGAP